MLVFGPNDVKLLAGVGLFAGVFRAPAAAHVVDVQLLAGGRNSVGLSTLCEAVLGAPLDKAQRMSDWMRRPLLPAQARYAALDAAVLPALARALLPMDGAGAP